jgi:hypothetical protein
VFESQFWRRYCQTFSTGFSSGAREGRKIGVMLSGTSSLPVVCHPARSRDENGVGALGDVARGFVEVELHHVSVGVGQHEGRPDAAGRADRAEQIGVVVALVGGLPWPRSAPGPLPNLAVLLADAGLVFKPDFDRRRLGQAVDMSLQRAREVFLKASTVRSS